MYGESQKPALSSWKVVSKPQGQAMRERCRRGGETTEGTVGVRSFTVADKGGVRDDEDEC